MGAKIDRATHYIFGTAFYTLLVNLLSDKFNICLLYTSDAADE